MWMMSLSSYHHSSDKEGRETCGHEADLVIHYILFYQLNSVLHCINCKYFIPLTMTTIEVELVAVEAPDPESEHSRSRNTSLPDSKTNTSHLNPKSLLIFSLKTFLYI